MLTIFVLCSQCFISTLSILLLRAILETLPYPLILHRRLMAAAPPSPIQRTPSSSRRAEDDELRPYVIVSSLGKGSFATVYKGYNEVRHRRAPVLLPACSYYSPITRNRVMKSQSRLSVAAASLPSLSRIFRARSTFSNRYPIGTSPN